MGSRGYDLRHLTLMIIVALGALGLAGCLNETERPREDCWCTTEFAQICITVIDAEGLTVPDIHLEVTMTRTGEVLDSSRFFDNPELGRYAIFNDSFKDLVTPGRRFTGEEIRVVGYRKEPVFDETFRVGVSDECRCHVRKISGTDTVRVD